MESVKISPKKCKIAMVLAGHHSCHGNVSVILLLQNMFPKGKFNTDPVNAGCISLYPRDLGEASLSGLVHSPVLSWVLADTGSSFHVWWTSSLGLVDNHYEGHKVQVGNVNPPAVGTSGVMVRKSTPKRAIMSIRHTGLSLFPAYLIAIARASISSFVVNPKPCIIHATIQEFFEENC